MRNKAHLHMGFLVLLALTLGLVNFSPVLAQTPAAPVYTLGLNRDFGYGAGCQIRGMFSAHIAGPEGITRVVYWIDGQTLAEVSAAPFSFQFNTSSYPAGAHTLTAEVTTADGQVFTTPPLSYIFVTQAQESEGMKNILVPLLGLIFGILLITVLAQTLLFKRKKQPEIPMGAARNYGYAGGAICPRCHRPTPRHVWGLNILVGKFDSCEACGKWSVMRQVPLEILRAAEEAEKSAALPESPSPVKGQTAEEKLREMVEKSKYDNPS